MAVLSIIIPAVHSVNLFSKYSGSESEGYRNLELSNFTNLKIKDLEERIFQNYQNKTVFFLGGVNFYFLLDNLIVKPVCK